MIKIVLYTYHIDEERFSQNSDLILEREISNFESRNEKELIFAVGTLPTMHIRIAIASKQGEVYYDQHKHLYRVWFYEHNKDKAIEAIGNYILDRVAPEIRTHRSFIKRLENERISAIKLLENLT